MKNGSRNFERPPWLGRLDIKPDYDARPYKSIARLKSFRDTVAHGKPDEEEYDEVVEVAADGSDARPDLTGKRQKICATDSVLEIYDDVDTIWNELIKKSDLNVFDTLTHGQDSLTFMEKVAKK